MEDYLLKMKWRNLRQLNRVVLGKTYLEHPPKEFLTLSFNLWLSFFQNKYISFCVLPHVTFFVQRKLVKVGFCMSMSSTFSHQRYMHLQKTKQGFWFWISRTVMCGIKTIIDQGPTSFLFLLLSLIDQRILKMKGILKIF